MKILWVSEFDDNSMCVGYVTESGIPQYKIYFSGAEIPDNVKTFMKTASTVVAQNKSIGITRNSVKLIYYYTGGITE